MKRNDKISKGYRLKSSTHKLIKNLKGLTNKTYDEVIKRSCKLYLQNLKNPGTIKSEDNKIHRKNFIN